MVNKMREIGSKVRVRPKQRPLVNSFHRQSSKSLKII